MSDFSGDQQSARAAEQAPGEPAADEASTPGDLPAPSWLALLARALRHLHASRLPLISAGVAFFAVLSVAPVLVVAVSVYGLVNTPQEGLEQLAEVAEVLPPEVESMVADQLTTLTTASDRGLTLRGLAGLVIALWTATTAMVALTEALTIAYHETETRRIARRLLLAFALAVGGALLLGAVLVVAGVVSRAVADVPDPVRVAGWATGWVVLAVLMSAVLAVLYRFGPDRREPRWRWASWGAVGATVLWASATTLLFAYVQMLGTYRTTYGSLAGVAISMFWVWMTVLLVVLGAAVNGEAERQTVRDSTVGRERPLGSRGAVVADSTPDRLHRDD